MLPALAAIFAELYLLIIKPLTDENVVTLDTNQYWALALPVFFGSLLVLVIVMWIGYTMIVTKEPIKKTYDSAYEEAAGELQEKSG